MPVLLLEKVRNGFRPTDHGEDVTSAPVHGDYVDPDSPRAFVIGDEEGICKLVTMMLATMGVEAQTYHSAQDAVAAPRLPRAWEAPRTCKRFIGWAAISGRASISRPMPKTSLVARCESASRRSRLFDAEPAAPSKSNCPRRFDYM